MRPHRIKPRPCTMRSRFVGTFSYFTRRRSRSFSFIKKASKVVGLNGLVIISSFVTICISTSDYTIYHRARKSLFRRNKFGSVRRLVWTQSTVCIAFGRIGYCNWPNGTWPTSGRCPDRNVELRKPLDK